MKRLPILILGAGGMGQRHVNAFSQTGRCDVYSFDPNPTALGKIRERYVLAGFFSNLNTVPPHLFSGAVISTPTNTHLSYAKWCLDQKIPFLIEKPIATHEDGIAELIAECKMQNLVSGVAFPRRSNTAIQHLKNRLHHGVIGELKLIRCNFAQDFRKYRPDYNKTYYARLATGGGAIMDALSHHINLACYFGGRVKQVSAFYDRLMFEGVEGEDCAFINLRFQNGILAAIHGNQFQKPNEDFIELIGSAGNLRYERITGKLTMNMCDSLEWHDEEIDGNWDKVVLNQASEFLDAVEKGEGIKTTLDEGLHHLQVVLAARLSQKSRSVIEISE